MHRLGAASLYTREDMVLVAVVAVAFAQQFPNILAKNSQITINKVILIKFSSFYMNMDLCRGKSPISNANQDKNVFFSKFPIFNDL